MQVGRGNRPCARRAVAGAAVLVAAVFGLAASYVPARAGDLDSFHNPDANQLSVMVQGYVPSRCALGNGGTVDMGDLTQAAVADVQIGLTCNLPFILRVQARNGALLHNEMPAGQGGYHGRLPYGVNVVVPLLDPAATRMSGSYSSAQLRSGVALDSARAIAAGGASLKFSTPGSNESLLAGQYSETITLTIQPKM